MSQKDIGRHLAELNNLIHRQMLKIGRTGDCYDKENSAISNASSCIIAYLYDHNSDDIFQRDLENEFHVRRSTMSKVLTALEQKGFIQRIAVKSDRRLKKIVLTDKASAMADELKQTRTRLEQRLMSNISEAELIAFKNTIEKMKQNLIREDEI